MKHMEIPRRSAIAGLLAATGSAVAGSALLRGRGEGREASTGYVTPESFGAIGDGTTDDAVAFRRACLHCAISGDHLRLSRRRYRGARIEVHGSFDVIGEGATVDYLGIGNTLVEGKGQAQAAMPTPWPSTDRDAYADLFPVRGGGLLHPVRPGADTLELRTTKGLRRGDRLFVAQRPTSMSSGNRPGNYIPSDFAFARVQAVNGTRVMLTEPLEDGFEVGAAAFASPGIATDCRISDLTIVTNSDAYQHVLRSGVDITLERITFAGQSAVGACTFADRLTYRDCRATGAYGPLSIARGCGRVLIEGFQFSTRREPATAEPFAIFLEESLRDVVIRRVEADGAGFSIRSTDLGRAIRRGRVLVDGCSFRTDNAVSRPTGPFQGGVAIGLDIDVRNSAFRGAAVQPSSDLFPGIRQPALTWMASTGSQDRLTFTGCQFESVNEGAAFAMGSGFQGRLALDQGNNRFIGCRPFID